MANRKKYFQRYYKLNRKRYRFLQALWWKRSKKKLKFYRKYVWKTWNQKAKLDVVYNYGGKCRCCGETNLKFLTIDHIYNDGYKERIKQVGGSRIYAMLRRKNCPKKRYQLLCWNCNCGKRMNKGICPHKETSK